MTLYKVGELYYASEHLTQQAVLSSKEFIFTKYEYTGTTTNSGPIKEKNLKGELKEVSQHMLSVSEDDGSVVWLTVELKKAKNHWNK